MSTRLTFERDSVLLAQLRREAWERDCTPMPVPLSDGFVARLLLPHKMSRDEANKICAVVSALAG